MNLRYCNSADFINLNKDILRQGKAVRFQARGWSMAPFIKDGDILEVKPVDNGKIKIGEVIFLQDKSGKIIAHRVIKIEKKVLTTKGDALSHVDGDIPLEQVLGKVAVIVRNRRRISMDNHYWRIYSFLAFFKRRVKPVLAPALANLQGIRFYGVLAKKIFNKKNVIYKIATQEEAYASSRFYDIREPFEISDSDIEYLFIAKSRGKIIGSLSLINSPNNDRAYSGWWIFSLRVRPLYRRLGVGSQLLGMAMKKACDLGADQVKVFAFKSPPAQKLYQKLDFKRIFIPEIGERLKREVRQGLRERIILAKYL